MLPSHRHPADPLGTVVGSRPTTLSARAAERLANGPLDALTLMRDVCQIDRLHPDAAERMALALLSSHGEFAQLPSGHWTLTQQRPAFDSAQRAPVVPLAPGDGDTNAGHPIRSGAAPSTHGAAHMAEAAVHTLSAVNFAVVDVETTGTGSGLVDRVTEIAIARVQQGRIVDVFSQLVNPERPIPRHITALTQITWDMVRDQPPFRQIANEVTTRLAGHVFVAHNAAFDWRFCSDELGRGGIQLSGPRLCTVRLARLLLPQLARRSLDHVTRYFGIDITSRHRAAGDAEATALVLLKLLRIAEDEGLSTWPLLEDRLSSPAARRARSASDRRRRAFPHPVAEDSSA